MSEIADSPLEIVSTKYRNTNDKFIFSCESRSAPLRRLGLALQDIKAFVSSSTLAAFLGPRSDLIESLSP